MGHTTIQEDKFSKTKTITWNAWQRQPDPMSKLHVQASLGIIWEKGNQVFTVDEGIGMGMRYILDAKGNEIVSIDYEFHDYNWLFLRQGSLKVLLDNDVALDFPAHEILTKTYSAHNKSKIFEKGYYTLTKAQFKQICDANKVEVRISGQYFIDFSEAKNSDFQFMLRSMYNESIDTLAYREYLDNREIQSKQDGKKKGKGCLKTVIIAIVVIFILGIIIESC